MMGEEKKIETEEVEAVATPPRARVERRGDFERKRDYLAGFLEPKPEAEPAGAPGGELHEAVIEALKSIYDPEIPVDIYELGLIYDVEITDDRRRDRHHDADHAALPGRRIDARRGRAARPRRSPASAMPRSNWSGIRRGTRRR